MTEQQEPRAWESFSDEQKMIGFVPVGYRYEILLIAYTKHMLTTCRMKTHERLSILEKLNGFADAYLTAEMLAMIEPMSETEVEMLHEAMTLDRGDKRCAASFDVLTKIEVFQNFARVNPSLLAAIKSTPGAMPPKVAETIQ